MSSFAVDVAVRSRGKVTIRDTVRIGTLEMVLLESEDGFED